ncbi:D-alanyl-D-alanine carboxypeptidase family protein [Cryobacterium breve]|uniref:D-alanyl-D-alanine carboxypeptidase family protein n=1 Tax=Cryobacterium breve TaxID=1259258 RepID=A0ABY2IZF1_9MICO|nr:D-alanyl-D-alanine carboxypeptidase family protein [Cryobacterium breve]TFC98105.1 D-alanyl-D-alanine carboxypeptidase family protein [Cryobacterium sp. TmT3-12]
MVIAVLSAVAVLAGAVTGVTSPLAVSPVVDPTSVPLSEPTISPTPTRAAPTDSPEPAVVPTFDRSARSLDDPASLWLVVDKTRPLNPADYAPTDLVEVPVAHVWTPLLRQEAAASVVSLFAAFEAETGLQLQSQSAYRSYTTQVDLYAGDVDANGQAVADRSTARPGTSEHQTGLAIDISALPGNCSLATCFGDTVQGQWLAQNGWRFGFLLRYPADKVEITGYAYEPWHFRFIGTELATEMHAVGVTTLEEFFGLPAAPGYN